jgi:tetraacyldisaccharide 4'-kinase
MSSPLYDARRPWQRSPDDTPLRLALAPLALLYGGAAAAVGAWQAARAWQCRCPVLAVGNLEVGGTGKTPTVIALAELLLAAGWRPGIVTGLWGRAARGVALLARDDADFTRQAPDEARLLAARLPGLPLVAARRKWQGARRLDAEAACDCILVDDGFQHRRLARRLDLVLLSPGCRLSAFRLLPAGPLREFPRALARADAYGLLPGQAAPAAWPAPGLALEPLPPALVELTGAPGSAWPGGYLTAAGIAGPERFEAAATGAGLRVLGRLRFADHADWSPRLRGTLLRAAGAWPGARFLLTEKDAQRWASFWDLPGPPPQMLRAGLRFCEPAAAQAFLRARLARD